MDIIETEYSEIEILKSWFPDKEAGYNWCGPGFRFPFSHESFLQDIRWKKIPTYSLHNDEGQFIGFGQYYEKLQRCHLARLVVSPAQRSMGVGRRFISRLMNMGMKDLGTRECSLFVVNNNENALNCYKSLGFMKHKYPPDHEHFEDIDFMVYKNT
jgi:ribosomal protein S18 acetylase RimI-like enzyme